MYKIGSSEERCKIERICMAWMDKTDAYKIFYSCIIGGAYIDSRWSSSMRSERGIRKAWVIS